MQDDGYTWDGLDGVKGREDDVTFVFVFYRERLLFPSC